MAFTLKSAYILFLSNPSKALCKVRIIIKTKFWILHATWWTIYALNYTIFSPPHRIQRHPDGPSATTSYCPNHARLGIFRDNSAHTFGWYGLWIHKYPEGYFPKDGDAHQVSQTFSSAFHH